MTATAPRRVRMVLRAALAAGVISGAPSTADALRRRRPALAATRAAGTLLGAPTVARGVVAHAVMTIGWTTVLAAWLPRRRRVAWGAAAGMLIGLVDLEIARRCYPAIDALARRPQLLDHITFGAVVGLVTGRGPQPRTGAVE